MFKNFVDIVVIPIIKNVRRQKIGGITACCTSQRKIHEQIEQENITEVYVPSCKVSDFCVISTMSRICQQILVKNPNFKFP
jgi:hypothetical protein